VSQDTKAVESGLFLQPVTKYVKLVLKPVLEMYTGVCSQLKTISSTKE